MAFLGVLLVRDLGSGAAETALVLTCFGVATIPSRIVGGHLTDAWGHRPTMLLGLVGCAVAQLVIAAAPGFAWALLGAVLLGLAYEVVEPPTQALVSDLVPEDARAFAYSALNASLAVAGVLAGLVAAAVSGAGLRWLFVVDAATCLACAALVARRIPRATFSRGEPPGRPGLPSSGHLPTPTPTPPHHARRPRSVGRGAPDRRLRPVVAFGTVAATVTMVVVSGCRSSSSSAVWPRPSRAGSSPPAPQPASPARGSPLHCAAAQTTRGVLLVGEVVASAGLATIALAVHPATLALGLVAFDVGGLLVIATTMARAGTLAPEGSRGTYLAVLGLTWGLATSVAPVVLTTLGTAYGPGAPFGAAALALLATAVVRAGQRPRLRRRTSLGGRPPAYDREGSTT